MSININVEFNKKTGKMKALNGVCCAPYSSSAGPDQTYIEKYFKEGNIPYCRTHDCEGAYGGTYYVDVPNIFRDFDADENDPNSYDFYYTDEYLTAVQKTGCEIYYRLGVTIEWGSKKYTTIPPSDFKKWARICEHIIMHYNHGWADGFHYDIKYWEIWNEPENHGNKFGKCMWGGTDEEFYRLYEISSKHLKKRFPEIKIGGYGGCGFYEITRGFDVPWFKGFVDFFKGFLEMVKEKGCPLDFYSWHIYTMDENELLTHAKFVRETLNEYGFDKTESHLNEWNIADEGTGYKNKHTMEGGSYLTAVMCMLQNTNYVDKAMYYRFCFESMYNGFWDHNDLSISPAWYPFAAYGKIYGLDTAVSTTIDTKGIYATAGMADDKKAMIISNYNCGDGDVEVSVNADESDIKAYVTTIDENFKGEYNTTDSTTADSGKIKLSIPKHTVVYIEFE